MHLFILINTTILECFEDSTNLIYLKTKVKVMGERYDGGFPKAVVVQEICSFSLLICLCEKMTSQKMMKIKITTARLYRIHSSNANSRTMF